MQASSEGETRGVGRTRPAGKAKEKVTEERVCRKVNEEDLAKHGSPWITPPGHVGSGRGRDGGRWAEAN